MLSQPLKRFLSPLLITVLTLLLCPPSPDAALAQRRTGRSSRASQTRRKTPARSTRAQTSRRQGAATGAPSNAEAGAPDEAAATGADSIAPGATNDEGVRADLPAGGELRIENRRGGVSVEVWNEQHVSVTARVAGRETRSSPVVIQRTEELLTIGVVRAQMNAPARVDLLLRVPARSRTEIVTTGGGVSLVGTPASVKIQTASGDISVEFASPPDADVKARTGTGSIDSTLPTRGPTGANEHEFQARLGAGTTGVDLRSTSGSITLSTAPEASNRNSVSAQTARETGSTAARRETASPAQPTEQTATAQQNGAARRPPTLSGTTGTVGAGTPAGPSTDAQDVDEGDVVRVDTELVTLNVSVVGRGSNRGLPDLQQSDFRLYEDGTEQQVSHFNAASAPFNLVLLIDLSGSTHEVVNIIRNAALRFVAATRPADRISVVTFSNTPIIVSRLTSDREALRQRINAIEEPQGSTKVYDSIAFTMSEVLKDAGASRRNAIVLMSDGLDSTMPNVTGEGSQIDYKELLSRIQEFDGIFYSLWLNTEYEALSDLDVQPETVDLAHDRMKEIAEAGGGLFYEVEKLEDLAGAYERVVADLGTVYSLGYRPTNKLRDGKWRAIRVAVNRPNAVARGKRGYYAN